MLWRSISGVMAVILPDSWKAALRWSCLAGIFGHKLAHCGRCIACVWAEKVVLCGAKLGEQPRGFNCGAAQALPSLWCQNSLHVAMKMSCGKLST